MQSITESPEAVGFSSERLARIKPAMQAYVERRAFAGISTMLARRGQIVHVEQCGWQDRESRTPLAADTIYRIYSMTKPIVATALMTLYEEGRFQLIDPVSKFLPVFGNVKVLADQTGTQTVDLVRPITIRDLLTHTSGLSYNFLEDSPVGTLYNEAGVMSNADRSLEAMIDEIARFPLAFQPGTRWHYSVGIDVAARLIEVISGQSLQDFLDERLFGPLGMIDTGFAVAPANQQRIATMYGLPDIATNTFSGIFTAWMSGFNGRIDVDTTYPINNTTSFARGGHGLFSTTSDYMRFAQMLLNRGELGGTRILGPKTVDFMHMNHVPLALLPYEIGGIPSGGYGFGLGSRVLLNVAESGVPGSVSEYGWGGAAKTYYWVDPQEDLIGILMTQSMVAFDTVEKDFQVLAYQAMLE